MMLMAFSGKEKVSNNLGRLIKQQRFMNKLTLRQLSDKSGVSPSHLARIERGERFPSGCILRKIAKPLGFDESELLILAGYLSPRPATGEAPNIGQLDPYLVAMLSREPVEIQRAVVTILSVIKTMALCVLAER